jgi:hypothetical protein
VDYEEQDKRARGGQAQVRSVTTALHATPMCDNGHAMRPADRFCGACGLPPVQPTPPLPARREPWVPGVPTEKWREDQVNTEERDAAERAERAAFIWGR